MSSSTRNNTSYDERYAVPLEASRRGAHRARRNPVLGALPFVLVLAVVVVVGLAAFTVFGPEDTASQTVAGAEPGADAGNETVPSAPASATAGAGSSAEPSASATASPSETATGGAAGEADRTVDVMVLNGAGVTGLAAKVKTQLEGDEWSKVEVDTAKNKTSRTTVYYADEDQEATAQALAADLGSDRVRQDADVAAERITAVIGSDFELAG